jgi:hypothetical protein
MTNSNNPAGRLYNLFEKGKKPSYKKDRVREVWTDLLYVPKNDNSILLGRIGRVMALPPLIEKKIRQEEDIDHSVYLRWLPKVSNAFKLLNLEAPWHNFIEPIDQMTLYGLEICSEQLSRKQPELEIKTGDIEKIKNEVEKLLQEIISSDIEKNLKDFLLNHIGKIKNAIEEYEFEGVVPLQKAFESTIGAISLHPEIHEKIKSSKHREGFWTFLTRVALVLSLVVGSIQIGKDTIPLLPSPEVEIEETQKNEIKNNGENKLDNSQENSTQVII